MCVFVCVECVGACGKGRMMSGNGGRGERGTHGRFMGLLGTEIESTVTLLSSDDFEGGEGGQGGGDGANSSIRRSNIRRSIRRVQLILLQQGAVTVADQVTSSSALSSEPCK